jgi:branched-chain amino acid transport system permease protein
MRSRALLVPLGIAALAVVVERVAGATQTQFYLTQLTMSAYYSLAALGLALLMGHAGQISLAHAGFFAIGGYTSAVLLTRDLSLQAANPLVQLLVRLNALYARPDAFGGTLLCMRPWPALFLALCLTGIVSVMIGVPVLRLKGHYLAMATLGAGAIIQQVLLGTRWLGEADGISDVPPLPFFGELALGGARSLRVANYYMAWGLLVVTLAAFAMLRRSRVGRALRAIHGDEEAAAAMAIDTAQAKLKAFVLSAVVAGLAGALLTHYTGGIGPSEAGVTKSVRYVALVAVGGMTRFGSVALASAALSFLSLRGYFGTYDDAIFGLILVVAMLGAPEWLKALRWPRWRRER